jgi:hypothetical protein
LFEKAGRVFLRIPREILFLPNRNYLLLYKTLFSSVQKNNLFCTKDYILLYKNAQRYLGGLKKNGECLQKDRTGWKETKPAMKD